MKLIIRFFLVLLAAAPSFGQDLSVLVNISPNPSNHFSDWQSGKNTVTVTLLNIRRTPAICNAEATLSLNGEIIADTKKASTPSITILPGTQNLSLESVFPQSSFELIGDRAKQISRTGILPEGGYELCVTIKELGTSIAISGPMEIRSCGNTYVHAPYIPVILSPVDGSHINSSDLVNIVWTPDPSTQASNFIIDFYEILSGQTTGSASRSNQTIVEKRTGGNSIVIPALELFNKSNSLPSEKGKMIDIIVRKDAPNETPSVPTHVVIIPDTIKKIAANPDTIKKIVYVAPKPRVVPRSQLEDSSAIKGTASQASFTNSGKTTEVTQNDQGHQVTWQFWGNSIYIGGFDSNGVYQSVQFNFPDSLFGNSSFLSQVVSALLKDMPDFPHVCGKELDSRCIDAYTLFWGRIVSSDNSIMTQTVMHGEVLKEEIQNAGITMSHGWIYDCKTKKFIRRFSFQASGTKNGKEFKLNFFKDIGDPMSPDC